MSDKQPEELSLSARVRPNVEAAPWVCEEIAKQEAELRRLHTENAELKDEVEWNDKGLAGWRDRAMSEIKQAKAARATAQIAITHLQKVLDIRSSYDDLKAAETAAREWLESIGAET
jgi:hypothetical protein